MVSLRLRPDPLLEARRRRVADGDDSGPAHGSVSRGLRVVAGIPAARLGLLTLALGHVVMVSVMVMTPLHMAHGDAGLELIGLVISIHIVGMFAFSPLTGMAVDRFGGRAVAVVGSVVLSTATLLGVGLAGGRVAHPGPGAVPARPGLVVHPGGRLDDAHRGGAGHRAAGAQGASDLVMGLVAGLGGRSPVSWSTGPASPCWRWPPWGSRSSSAWWRRSARCARTPPRPDRRAGAPSGRPGASPDPPRRLTGA